MKFKLSGFFKALGSETLDERYTEAMRLAGTFLSLEYLSSADEFTSLPRVAGQETLFFLFCSLFGQVRKSAVWDP